mmetsp:Transcript_8945/g.22909  ORF Transcript_8945/g.22909 Transcript_8945/m.22909 type:complete len:216 (-) Transcript_8945:137-784(-)
MQCAIIRAENPLLTHSLLRSIAIKGGPFSLLRVNWSPMRLNSSCVRFVRPSVRPSIHRLTHALTRGVTSLLVVLDGDGVHAVPGVGGGLEPLALEDVAQVPITLAADNLDAHAVGVGNLLDGPRQAIVEGGPAAAGVELGLALVKGRVAPRAAEHAVLGVELVVLAGAGVLGAFHSKDSELLVSQQGLPFAVADLARLLASGQIPRRHAGHRANA